MTTRTLFGFQIRTVDPSTRRLITLGATGPAWATEQDAAAGADAAIEATSEAGQTVTDLALVRYVIGPDQRTVIERETTRHIIGNAAR